MEFLSTVCKACLTLTHLWAEHGLDTSLFNRGGSYGGIISGHHTGRCGVELPAFLPERAPFLFWIREVEFRGMPLYAPALELGLISKAY